MSFCDSCIAELETAVDIREHFKKIETFWIQFLNQQKDESIAIKQELDYQIFAEPDYFQSDVDIKTDRSSISQTGQKLQITLKDNAQSDFLNENLVTISNRKSKQKRNQGK